MTARFISAYMALVAILLASSPIQAELVGKYDANLGVELEGDEVANWEDQVGGYHLDDSTSFPNILNNATPSGSAAIDFDAELNTHLSGIIGPDSEFPLVEAEALTTAVVFSPDEDPGLGDNDPNNPNFWGHPQLASGDQGGSHSDWGFSWGEDADGEFNIWFGTGPDDGVPTVTASGAAPDDGENNVWYVGVGTWDSEEAVVGAYLYDQSGTLMDSDTLEVPSAIDPRIDIGFSTGAERPNLNARNFDGQIAAIELYDNWVDGDGANAIAADLVSTYLGGGGGVAGDFNGNGERDPADMDELTAAITAGDADPKYDVNGDGSVNNGDREFWLIDLTNTYFGDSNFDGEFNSSDFVTVFAAAKYETGQAAIWVEGDWNGDGQFHKWRLCYRVCWRWI